MLKSRIQTLVLLFMIGAPGGSFAASEKYQIQFESVVRNPFWVPRPDSNDVLYQVYFYGPHSFGTGLRASELAPAMKLLGAKTPEDLQGKFFPSDYQDPRFGLDRIRMNIATDGHYVPPSPTEFYELLAKAFIQPGRTQCPQTKDFADLAATFDATGIVFTKKFGELDPKFISLLEEKFERLSNGQAKLELTSDPHDGSVFILFKDGKPEFKFGFETFSREFLCWELRPASATAK